VTEHSNESPASAASNAAPLFGVLSRLRTHFKGRVSNTNLDYIPHPLTKVLRAKYRGHRLEIWANETMFLLQVFGAYLPIGGMYVTVAAPGLRKEEPVRFLEASAKSYAIYSMVGPLDAPMKKFLESDVLARVLEIVGIGEKERLVIYSSQIHVRQLSPTFDRVVGSIDAILDLIPESHVIEKRDYSDLPLEFSPLLPLLPVWDVSDDEDRWLKVKRSSRATRKRLIEAVNPFMAKISAYLDSFGDRPISDSASALDSLAQAAMEADVSLKS
jgi:hypothetical protein